jgi:hypothetical protein
MEVLMKDPVLRRLAETLGWIAYLHVVGAGEYRRDLLKIDPSTAIEGGPKRRRLRSAAPDPAKVLRLEEYRAKRRRRAAARSTREGARRNVA